MHRENRAPYSKYAALLNLNRRENHLLVLCFCIAALLVFWGVVGNIQLDEPSQILPVLSFWASVASPVVSVILFRLGNQKARRKEAKRQERKRREDAKYQKKIQERRHIPRDAQLTALRNAIGGKQRFLFLYGESGCGKTTLLHLLKSELKECVYKKDRYHESWAEAFAKSSEPVVIFDQFELALQNRRELTDFFAHCKTGGPSKIIFSFKNEAFGPIVSVLCACGISIKAVRPLPLTYTPADQEALRRKTLNGFQWNESTSREELASGRGGGGTTALLAEITERIYAERILLIEWSLIMDAVCRFSPDEISDLYQEQPDFHSFMSRLMLLTVRRFSYPEIALPILYLLGRNLNEAYSITFKDFQLATVRRKEAVELTVRELKEAGWIRPVLGSAETMESGTEFEISHEYLGKMFVSICNAQLDAEILKNLNNYEFSSRHGSREASGNSGKRRLYQDYRTGRESRRLGVILRVLLSIVVFSAVLRRVPDLIKPEWTPRLDLFQTLPSMGHVCVLLVCGLSTFYVYNFSYFVFCPYRLRAALVEVFGSLMVTLCLIHPPWWPMFLASEIILVGGVLVSCFPKSGKTGGGKFLQTPGSYFILFGLFIFFLGLFFQGVRTTFHPVAFGSFILFILSAIKLHINYDFVYYILGKFES